MCDGPASAAEVAASVPRLAEGPAVDPIDLHPVDEVRITTLVDNVYDALLPGDGRVSRVGPGTSWEPAPQFGGGRTDPGLRAEHGFAALVTVRRGPSTTTLLFDTGLSPDGMVTNAARMGIDLSGVQAVVLSHGHFDHVGGLAGLAGRRGARAVPMVLHPGAWTRRRLAPPNGEVFELPTLSRRAVEGEGFQLIERREPSLLVDGSVLITGEVDRTTPFETGFRGHEALRDTEWQPDPLILDDQALVLSLRDRGLVLLSGCGHAGIVNTVRYARTLTGIDAVAAVIGGFHLSGPMFEPIIDPTIDALAELAPSLLVPAHCTGWKAVHRMATRFPDAFVMSAVGTTITV